MSKKSRTKKNGRTTKSSPTVAVQLTEWGLMILRQSVVDRMTRITHSLKETVEDDSRDEREAADDRRWHIYELEQANGLLTGLRRRQ